MEKYESELKDIESFLASPDAYAHPDFAAKSKRANIDEFNAKDETYREAHFDEESDRFDKLGHKIVSLGYLIKFRNGEVECVFPDEYQSKTAISGASGATSTPQKKLGFFARLFGRGAQ